MQHGDAVKASERVNDIRRMCANSGCVAPASQEPMPKRQSPEVALFRAPARGALLNRASTLFATRWHRGIGANTSKRSYSRPRPAGATPSILTARPGNGADHRFRVTKTPRRCLKDQRSLTRCPGTAAAFPARVFSFHPPLVGQVWMRARFVPCARVATQQEKSGRQPTGQTLCQTIRR